MNKFTVDDILVILNQSIKGNEITVEQINEDLADYGLDSISFITIIIKLEKMFDCEIPDSKLLLSEMNTVQKIINILNSLE